MYNRVLTAMLAMDEWSRFAYRKATLRVSYPTGGQRSTYWLHLPYRFSVPLLIVTSVMHWLVSQSIFLARLELYDANGNPLTQSNPTDGPHAGGAGYFYYQPTITTIGYSPKALVATIALGSAMIIFLIGLGFRRYKGGIPLICNNSLSISAACHPLVKERDAAHSKVMWGAVSHGDDTTPGRCCLTSTKSVVKPSDKYRYA